MGFRVLANGTRGKAEACGRIRIGDILVAINGHYIHNLPFRDVIALLTGLKHPYVYLRFLRTAPHDRYRYETHFLGDRIRPPGFTFYFIFLYVFL
jgi:hypothetical protein